MVATNIAPRRTRRPVSGHDAVTNIVFLYRTHHNKSRDVLDEKDARVHCVVLNIRSVLPRTTGMTPRSPARVRETSHPTVPGQASDPSGPNSVHAPLLPRPPAFLPPEGGVLADDDVSGSQSQCSTHELTTRERVPR